MFVTGSTAAVTTMEHEPGGVEDLRETLERLIPRDRNYAHNVRNHDDNAHSHLRASLLGPSETIPLVGGRLVLGTWQQLVLIELDDAEALMPVYLRFVKGVIDSSDLPLNVSRELLQESRDVKVIREGSTKRVLSMLEGLADSEDEAEKQKYAAFWKDFGVVLKEGIGEDHANQERLEKLLRFSLDGRRRHGADVSLADYVKRMKEGQDAIYYVTADTLATAKNSPQLEIFRKKGIEVLLLTDRVDEWLLLHLYEFDGKPLQSVAKGCGRPRQARGRGREEAGRGSGDRVQADARAPEGGAEGPRQGRPRDDPPGRLAGLPGRRGRRHERASGAAAEAGRPGRAEGQADPRGQRRARAGEAARDERRTSTTWRTSCSTRRCWPKAASSRIRPPT